MYIFIEESIRRLSSLLLSSPLQVIEIEEILKTTVQLKELYQCVIGCMHDILYINYIGTEKSFEFYSLFQNLIKCCKKRYLYFTHNLYKTIYFEVIFGDCFQTLYMKDPTNQARYLQSHSVEVLYIPPKDRELFHYFTGMNNDGTIVQSSYQVFYFILRP